MDQGNQEKMIKKKIKSLLLKCGFEIRRKASGSSDPLKNPFDTQKMILKDMGIHHPTIFDVGANVGQTATEYRLRFPQAIIYCFEPYPNSIQALKKMFYDDHRVHVIPLAIGEKSGTQTFYLTGASTTHSLLPRLRIGRRYYPTSTGPRGESTVSVTSIDEFSSQNSIEKIDILKFDVQGSEMKGLEGASDILEKGDVSLIFTDVNFTLHYEGGVLFHELWNFLSGFQYTLFDMYHLKRATNGQIRYADALFVSEKVRNRVIDNFPDEP